MAQTVKPSSVFSAPLTVSTCHQWHPLDARDRRSGGGLVGSEVKTKAFYKRAEAISTTSESVRCIDCWAPVHRGISANQAPEIILVHSIFHFFILGSPSATGSHKIRPRFGERCTWNHRKKSSRRSLEVVRGAVSNAPAPRAKKATLLLVALWALCCRNFPSLAGNFFPIWGF